jgi:hypothetical protein
MLIDECEKANIIFLKGINVQNIKKDDKKLFY